MPDGVIRYWAAAKAAAGVAEEPYAGNNLRQVLDAASARHDPDLAAVLARCSFLVDGQRVDHRAGETTLRAGAVIDVLPPFAGG